MINSQHKNRTLNYLVFLVFFLLTSQFALAADYKKVCGKFYIKKDSWALFNSVGFNENEKIFICGGDVKLWSKIPDWQAKKNISLFLQKEGYFYPEIKDEKDKTYIDPGKLSKIRKVKFIDEPSNFFGTKFIAAKGKVLMSSQLDEIEAWAISRLKRLGYPCPKVKITAYPESESVTVAIDHGKKGYIKSINRDVVKGVTASALSRFDSFRVGDLFNGNSLELSSRRIMNQNVVDYSNFSHECPFENEEVAITQDLSFGKPKRFSLAFGASTEQFPILQMSWLHSRIDENASQFELKSFLSPRELSLTATARWHVFNNLPRFYFLPLARVARNDESVFTFTQQTYSFGLGFTKDTYRHTYLIESRPTFNIENTIVGVGGEDSEYVSLDSKIVFYSHDFEYYQSSPRTGYKLTFNNVLVNNVDLDSPNGSSYSFNGTLLYNGGGFAPPLYVLGFRFKYAFIDADNLVNVPNRLRLFMGGDRDARGFGRNSLNNDDIGFQSIFYIGAEFRMLRVLPYNFQPFIFYDLAKAGLNGLELTETNFWNPGLGMRWQSPFGSFRTTAGYGFIQNPTSVSDGVEEDWTFYISYGQEF